MENENMNNQPQQEVENGNGENLVGAGFELALGALMAWMLYKVVKLLAETIVSILTAIFGWVFTVILGWIFKKKTKKQADNQKK